MKLSAFIDRHSRDIAAHQLRLVVGRAEIDERARNGLSVDRINHPARNSEGLFRRAQPDVNVSYFAAGFDFDQPGLLDFIGVGIIDAPEKSTRSVRAKTSLSDLSADADQIASRRQPEMPIDTSIVGQARLAAGE